MAPGLTLGWAGPRTNRDQLAASAGTGMPSERAVWKETGRPVPGAGRHHAVSGEEARSSASMVARRCAWLGLGLRVSVSVRVKGQGRAGEG